LGENLAKFPGVMLFLPLFFVKLLVLKGLASESPPIDRKGQDPKVCLGNSPSHRYQPDLRILTRSASSATARHFAGGRFVHPGVSHSQYDPPHDRGRVLGRFLYTRIFRVSEGKTAKGVLGFRAASFLGSGRDSGGSRGLGQHFFEADRRDLYAHGSQPDPLGPGDLSESDHFPMRVFSGPGGAGGRYPEQLSSLRTSSFDVDRFQRRVHRLFVRNRLSAHHELGAARIPNASSGIGSGNCRRRGVATGDAAPSARQAGHALPPGRFLQRSRREEGRQADGPGVFLAWEYFRSISSWTRFLRLRRACRRAASVRCTWRTA